jgi:hypothetical protein
MLNGGDCTADPESPRIGTVPVLQRTSADKASAGAVKLAQTASAAPGTRGPR